MPVPSEMTIMAISEGRPCPDMTRRPRGTGLSDTPCWRQVTLGALGHGAVVGQSDAGELAASSAPAMGGVAAAEFRQVALRPA